MVSLEHLARSSFADELWLVEIRPIAEPAPSQLLFGSFGGSVRSAEARGRVRLADGGLRHWGWPE